MAVGTHYIGDVTLEEKSATPETPPSGQKRIYAKNDGKLYTLDDAGDEQPVGAGLSSVVVDNTNDGNTMVDKNRYLADTTTAAFTLNLPALADGAAVEVLDSELNFHVNNLTVLPQTGEQIADLPISDGLLLDIKGLSIAFYSDGTKWVFATQTIVDAVQQSDGSVTDNSIAVYDGVTGKAIKGSNATIGENGKLTINHADGNAANAVVINHSAPSDGAAFYAQDILTDGFGLRVRATNFAGASTDKLVEVSDGTNSLFSVTKDGTNTIGPSSGGDITHPIQSGANTRLRLQAGTTSSEAALWYGKTSITWFASYINTATTPEYRIYSFQKAGGPGDVHTITKDGAHAIGPSGFIGAHQTNGTMKVEGAVCEQIVSGPNNTTSPTSVFTFTPSTVNIVTLHTNSASSNRGVWIVYAYSSSLVITAIEQAGVTASSSGLALQLATTTARTDYTVSILNLNRGGIN